MRQLLLLAPKQATPIATEQKPVLELRNYQKRVIGEIYQHYHRNIKSVMLISPTGSGKTLTASHIIRDAVSRQCRVLFIVHREPLVDQTVGTLVKYGIPASTIGYIKAGYPSPDGHELVIVASIQTLARRDYPENVGLVIFDETHTTSFYETARDLIDHYSDSLLFQSRTKFLHLTATPYRTKTKEGFCHLVQRKVLAPDIKKLIKLGYLAPPRHFGYDGLQDFSKLETGRSGDYKSSELNVVCNDRSFNQQIVEKYLEICPDRKAIAFCGSVEQSLLLTELLKEKGVAAEHIQAETPSEIRKAIFSRFKQGVTQVLSSVGTLTEGFDEPSVEAVILARPTKSLALLIQMCGRGLRIYSGKEDCYLLDFGENFKRLGFVNGDRETSICPNPKPIFGEPTKECPNCQATVNNFAKVCPECGFEFEGGSDKSDDFILREFGELIDERTLAHIKYIRAQKKSRFTRNQNPEQIWELWDARCRDINLCHRWLYQAVFRGNITSATKQQYLNYLKGFGHGTQWVQFQMELEFGSSAIFGQEAIAS